jgi:parallel beta-helix repeat protein
MCNLFRLLVLGLAWHATLLPATATESGAARRGNVYYVRQTVGDDAHDGLSPETAWRSLTMLEDAMQAGDTAYVGPGLYREQVTVANSGTAENPITFIADTKGAYTRDPPGIVMITGADAVDETIFIPASVAGVYRATGLDKLVMNAVEMDGPQRRYLRAFDAPERIREGVLEIDVVAKRPSTLFYDREAKVVYIHTSDDKPPSTHEIELIRRNFGFVTFDKHYVTVIGFTFRHMGTAGINFDKDSSHVVALDNTSYGSWQGIRVYKSSDVLVANNVLFGNDNSGVYFFGGSTRGYAIGNVLFGNSKGARWGSGSTHGLALNNVTFGNREMGVSIEDADDVRISRNTFVANEISHLFVRKSRYVSRANCFEGHGGKHLIADVDHHERYDSLADYQRATQQDLDSREVCGRFPDKIDVHRLHAESSVYAERARKSLAENRK